MQIVNLMTPDPIVINPMTPWRTQRPLWTTAGSGVCRWWRTGGWSGSSPSAIYASTSGFLGSTRVNAAMRTALITVTPYNTVEDAARLMLKHKIGGLPIIAEGKLVGIVTTSDLLRAFLLVVAGTNQIMKG